jgi:hypothetical protein
VSNFCFILIGAIRSLSTSRYALVWEETAMAYREMIEAEGWGGMKEMTIPAINDYTTKVKTP